MKLTTIYEIMTTHQDSTQLITLRLITQSFPLRSHTTNDMIERTDFSEKLLVIFRNKNKNQIYINSDKQHFQ